MRQGRAMDGDQLHDIIAGHQGRKGALLPMLHAIQHAFGCIDAKAEAEVAKALNLSRAVQLCVDIGGHLISGLDVPAPDTMGQTFEILAQAGVLDQNLAQRLRKAVGFRNIAVHNYDAINWHIVHDIAKNHVEDFSAFAKVVIGKLDQ